MSLEMNYEEREGIAVLELKGLLTFGKEDLDFRNELDSLLKIGITRVVLNLSNLWKLDNSGMGALLSARASLRNAGGNLAIVIMRPSQVGLITEAHLEAVFEVAHDEQDAINRFFPNREIKRCDIRICPAPARTATDCRSEIAPANSPANADLSAAPRQRAGTQSL